MWLTSFRRINSVHSDAHGCIVRKQQIVGIAVNNPRNTTANSVPVVVRAVKIYSKIAKKRSGQQTYNAYQRLFTFYKQ